MSSKYEPTDAEANPTNGASFPSTPARVAMPDWYQTLLDAITQRVTLGRLGATTAVNRELTATNWAIGRLILDRQDDEGWGSRVIDRLSRDLKSTFPSARGFSPRNLKYMRAFADAWPDQAIVQRVAQLPWRHQIALMQKLDEPDTRLWYASAAIEAEFAGDAVAADTHDRTDQSR